MPKLPPEARQVVIASWVQAGALIATILTAMYHVGTKSQQIDQLKDRDSERQAQIDKLSVIVHDLARSTVSLNIHQENTQRTLLQINSKLDQLYHVRPQS